MFWDYSKCRQMTQSALGLNRGLSSSFCQPRNVNHVKFTEQSVMCTENHDLIKKKIVLILQKYLFWDYSKCRQMTQSALGFNRGLSSSFCQPRNVNHVKFTEQSVMCTENHDLIKKKIVLILQKYLFWDYLKCRQMTQSALGLNRGLSSSFCQPRNVNHVKFTEQSVMCTENHDLIKKMITNWLNICHYEPE